MLNKGDAETIRFCQLFGLIPKKKKCPTCKQGMSVAYKRGRASLSSVDSNRLFVAVECDSAVYEVRDRVESRICGLACRQSAHFARGLVHSLPGLRFALTYFSSNGHCADWRVSILTRAKQLVEVGRFLVKVSSMSCCLLRDRVCLIDY